MSETFTVHHLATLVPEMLPDEYRALVADVRAHGLLEPIVLFQGQVLDGRHRYRACLETGTEPRFRPYEGDDPLGFVVSANLQRRHLTSSQRAVLALAFESEFAVQAKERQGARTDLTSGQSCTNVEHLHAAEPAASVVGVSERLVKDAKRLRREAPERLAGVLSGLYSLHEAIKEGQHQRRRAAVEAATLDPPPVPVTPKDTLATFGCGRHTGNGGYCVALDDLLAHADEAPGTCAEPFEMAARLRSAAFTQQGFPCFACRLHVS